MLYSMLGKLFHHHGNEHRLDLVDNRLLHASFYKRLLISYCGALLFFIVMVWHNTPSRVILLTINCRKRCHDDRLRKTKYWFCINSSEYDSVDKLCCVILQRESRNELIWWITVYDKEVVMVARHEFLVYIGFWWILYYCAY